MCALSLSLFKGTAVMALIAQTEIAIYSDSPRFTYLDIMALQGGCRIIHYRSSNSSYDSPDTFRRVHGKIALVNALVIGTIFDKSMCLL